MWRNSVAVATRVLSPRSSVIRRDSIGGGDCGLRTADSSDRRHNVLLLLLLLIAGTVTCRQDMHDQPKFKGYRGTSFFPDKRSARPVLEDTVARGQLRENEAFATGKKDGKPVVEMPVPITRELLARGRD